MTFFPKNNTKCSHMHHHQNCNHQFKNILISRNSKLSEKFIWLLMQTAHAKSVEDKWWNFVNFFINFNGIQPTTIKATLNCTNFVKSIVVMCTFIPSFRKAYIPTQRNEGPEFYHMTEEAEDGYKRNGRVGTTSMRKLMKIDKRDWEKLMQILISLSSLEKPTHYQQAPTACSIGRRTSMST